MRAATAYFAGVGTVAVAIAGGLGGGLLLGDIMSPQQPKYPSSEVTRLEQRASQQPIQTANGTTQPVPYMTATQIANTVAEQPAPAQQPQQAPSQQQAQPEAQQAAARPAEPPKQPERNTSTQPASAAAQPSPPVERPTSRAAADDSFAKARESDVKNDARRAEDRRKAERRQQWAERRRYDRRRQDDDLRDVELKVREDTERPRIFAPEPARVEMPRIRLFGDDD
jgi:outer membrane biosynthesis protein TonB